MNPITFIVLAGVLGVAVKRFGGVVRELQIVRRWIILGLSSCLGSLALMALVTAAGFIPEDWSACRLTWPGGLFYGYHLYMGNDGPSNGFFYPPVGAWFYLPAAVLGILFHSSMVGLVAGWAMSMGCIIAPIALLLVQLNRDCLLDLVACLIIPSIAICLILAVPQLRYVATLVHVDSPALLFLGVALVLILPLGMEGGTHSGGIARMIVAGSSLALAVFTKQSVWPLVPGVLIATAVFHGGRGAMYFCLSGSLAGVLLLAVTLGVENGAEAYRMIWQWPSHQIAITSVQVILKQLLLSNLPILGMLAMAFVLSAAPTPGMSVGLRHSVTALLLLALWMIPFAVMTRMRIGADWNHLAIPSYIAVLAIILLLPGVMRVPLAGSVISSLATSVVILGILAAALLPYLSKNCGWYLWSHNSHQQALGYLKGMTGRSEKIYFPWQAFSMLIAEKKLYHLDDCLRYEESSGWKRPQDSFDRYFPESPCKIAIRPFGAPSYLAQKNSFAEAAPIPELSGWHIYQNN